MFAHKKIGFTLIELLVTMSIIGILLGIGIAKYNEFNRRQILAQAAQELRSNLRFAQDKALAGEKPTGWCTTGSLRGYQVSFDAAGENYLIEAICSVGSPRQVKSVSLPDPVDGPNGTSVLFKVLAQGVADAASFTLTFPDVDSETVTVTATGDIR
jgi:prepilin-type N-terminal cleavage/methylation domain-containing protein